MCFCQFYRRATLPLPSWCIFCCCSASEREAFAKRQVEGQKRLLRGALCHMQLFYIGGSSRRDINRCCSSGCRQRGTICPLISPPVAPSRRVFLPGTSLATRLRSRCLRSPSVPGGSRHLAGGTCPALRVTASALARGAYLATRGSRFDEFLGRQLARLGACPCARLGCVHSNLAVAGDGGRQ